jgi:hypothetical protein
MFEVKRAIKAACKDLDLPGGRTLSVISSSWKAERMSAPELPCLITDLQGINPDQGTQLETGEQLGELHALPLTIVVPLTGRTDDDAEDDLETITDIVLGIISSLYGNNYTVQNWYSTNAPYGNFGEALIGSMLVTISYQYPE